MYPDPIFRPSVNEVVYYTVAGRNALVISEPSDPDPETFNFDELPEDQFTRPCYCTIMVGEDIIENVDVSKLEELEN